MNCKNTSKLEIVEYFDFLTNQIDIEAETQIALLHENQEDTWQCLKQINSIRSKYLEQIDQIVDINLGCFFEPNDGVVVFNKFAFFLNSKSLENLFSNKYLGLLIIIDWYLEERDLNLLKYSLNPKNSNLFPNESSTLVLDVNSIKVYFLRDLLKEIISKKENSNIVSISINQSKQIETFTFLENDFSFTSTELQKPKTDLNLFNLHLKAVGPSLFDNEFFYNLNDIKIENNQIEELLDNNLFNNQFKQLQHLSFKSNRIQRISNKLFESLNLTTLNLSINLIQNLETPIFSSLFSLKSLILSFNIIQKLSKESFKGLVNLETLHCDNNMIKEIQPDTFSPLKKLKILNLSQNKINLTHNCVQEPLFTQLTCLIDLDLSCNIVAKIESDSFEGLTCLEKLSLSANCIVSIKNDSFNSLFCLRELFIDDLCKSLFKEENSTSFLLKLDKLKFNTVK